MESRTARNTREFTLADAVSPRVRVVGVHDGDTLTVISELFPGRYYRYSVRVRGIDSCEMTSRDAQLHRRAEAARDRVVQLVTGDAAFALPPGLAPGKARLAVEERLERQTYLVTLEDVATDKYGRALAVVRLGDGASLGEVLLAEHLAFPYDGGSKLTDEEQRSR